MEVDLRPPMHGCLIALISLWTLGLYPLLRRLGERHLIRRMDASGITTRGGRHIPWNAITSVQHAESGMKGVKLSEEYLLASSKGKASLPMWRTKNPDELKGYLLQHLPSGVQVLKSTRVSYR